MGRYKAYWDSRLDPKKGDVCTSFDIHNTGGKVDDYESKRMKTDNANSPLLDIFSQCGPLDFDFNDFADDRGLICLDPVEYEKQALCPDLFTRFSIYTSGRVALCSADQAEYHPIGSVLECDNPEDLFNSTYFNDYRNSWLNRDVSCKSNCSECTVTVSRFNKHVS